MKITADFDKTLGKMKPLHGVNNGTRTAEFLYDTTEYFKEAGIPFSRLHDTEHQYGAGEFVDIYAVFKNFDADPTDPKNYNFFLTDHYIRSILEAGTKVIYRLGVSIENGPYKRYIYPPKDYVQFARICEGIVRHYTEGWADGFVNGVEYFEVWNEPEFLDHMWIGPYEEFYKMFSMTVKHLKACFPNVKIGGPATGFTQKEFTDNFITYIQNEKVPLDFFSYHIYFTHPDEGWKSSAFARNYLDTHGYEGVPIFITEWNYVTDWNNMDYCFACFYDMRGASADAAILTVLQNCPIDEANYYDAQMNTSFNGLFAPGKSVRHDAQNAVIPRKAFYSHKIFNELYKLGTQVEASSDTPNLYALAAAGQGKQAVEITYFEPQGTSPITVGLDIPAFAGKTVEIFTLDKENDLSKTYEGPLPETLQMSPCSVVFITCGE